MMKQAWVLFLMCGVLGAQDEKKEEQADPPVERKQGEKKVIVTSSPLNPSDLHDSNRSADVMDRKDIQKRRMSGTMPRALAETANVSVQETGPAQGSPFIRGLTSYHTVMLIDGIRLNHSGMRTGPNQYWGTVDPFLIDRLELVRGPSSVLYGSDALGGTVSAFTIEPDFEPGANYHSRSFYRYESAREAHVARQEFSGNVDEFGWIVGGTYKDFNDISGGRHVGEMKGTRYDEYDADLKFIYRTSENAKVVAAVQHYRMDDGQRWHSTMDNPGWHGTAPGGDIFRKFDQERNLAYLQYHWEGENGLVDAFKASVSWHRQAEKTERLRNLARREVREFEIDTPAAFVQAGKDTDFGFFTAGAEVYHDIVTSSGHDWNPGLIPFTRGIIADDAHYTSFGLYLQDEIVIGDLEITPGIRFSYIEFEADEVDPVPGGSAIVDTLDDSYSSVTGSLRLLYHVDENWNAIAGWGMGFRAPSLHDLTSTDLVLSGSLEVPSPGLDPEIAHTVDAGVRARYDRWELTAFAFYTWLDDFLRRVSVGDIDGDLVTDFSRGNFSDGWIYGYEVMALYRVTEEISAWFNWGYAKGRSDVVGGGDEPLSKMNPSLAHFGVRYEPEGSDVWVEAVISFADEQKHQSSADKGDTQRQPLGGTPGYTVAGVRGGYRVNENFSVSAAVENITDKDYRIHGSGQNQPGTNFVVGVDLEF